MDIKTIPLSRLEKELRQTLTDCADSGQAIMVELPDHRLVAIQSIDAPENDSLIDDLLQNNPEFLAMAEHSKASPKKPFVPRTIPSKE